MAGQSETSEILTAKNLQLIVSVVGIALVAIGYGLLPARFVPLLFHLKVETVKTIGMLHLFRVLMTLYLGMTGLWCAGIFKPVYWRTATLTNIVFMGGLASGRLISFFVDGVPSHLLVVACALEVATATWGLINLKKYRSA